MHPIATTSVRLHNILLNIKYDSLVAKDRNLKFSSFQTMNNVVVIREIVSANFDGFFKGNVGKKSINV